MFLWWLILRFSLLFHVAPPVSFTGRKAMTCIASVLSLRSALLELQRYFSVFLPFLTLTWPTAESTPATVFCRPVLRFVMLPLYPPVFRNELLQLRISCFNKRFDLGKFFPICIALIYFVLGHKRSSNKFFLLRFWWVIAFS
jgi:hypothetical protein